MGKREQGSVAVTRVRPEVALSQVEDVSHTVIVEVPVVDESRGGYLDTLPLHAEAALSNRRKAQEGLRRLHRAIHSTEKMSNGKFVVHRSDAIVWLLERIADA